MHNSFSSNPGPFSRCTDSFDQYHQARIDDEHGGDDPLDLDSDRHLFNSQPFKFNGRLEPDDLSFMSFLEEDFMHDGCVSCLCQGEAEVRLIDQVISQGWSLPWESL